MTDTMEREAKSTNLAVLSAPLNAAVVFAPGGVDAILQKIRAEVTSIKTDISTEAGRNQIRSLAFKVARSKTALDDMGKDLAADLKKQTGAIDAERRRIRDELDALKDQVRKPLTDWEDAEKARVDAHEAAIAAIAEVPFYGQSETAAEIKTRLEFLLNYPARDWQEFSARATEVLQAEVRRTRDLLSVAEKREEDRAELERLRREQIEREQRERDERIAAEAAERARTEAEAKAKREAEKAAAYAKAETDRIEAERRQAHERAEAAEAARVAQTAQAEREKMVAADAAERRQAAAIEAERKRVADAHAAEAAATARREKDHAHKATINKAAMIDLTNHGLSEPQARAVVVAIALSKISHVSIKY